jgi:transcriptional regulator with XRE-family HTH domain
MTTALPAPKTVTTHFSNDSFPETLARLLLEHDVSLRELSRRTMKANDWGRPSSISLLLNGELRPTLEAMEHIARALSISPDVFAEYRLARARYSLDPEAVGLKKALRNLRSAGF